ncbi:MAG TPA: hypothetical protein VN158_00965 [Caulobacter sp.]|nr:hypothetical protein [Caulobacter sp.]
MSLSLVDNAIYLIAYVAYLIALVICGVAIWKGDRPLRLAAAVLIVGWALSALTGHRDKFGMNYPMSIIDTNVALILVWISMRWRRIWCAVLAALTIVVVIIPFVALVDRDIHYYNRAASNNVVAILQLMVLAVATWLTVRARRRADEDTLKA